jgi:GNAT superfamily N-acetyltransferase
MGDVTVRPYKSSDQDGVIWLYQRTPPAGRVYVRPAQPPGDLTAIDASFTRFWVAEESTSDGDAVVGITGLEHVDGRASPLDLPIPDSLSIDVPTARLHHVMVVPERQRRGIGRALMAAAIHWARGSGYTRLILNTTSEQVAAVPFYESLGFREIVRTTYGRWELVWMEFELEL